MRKKNPEKWCLQDVHHIHHQKKPTSETLLRQSNHYAGSFHDLLFGMRNLPCEFSLPFINTHQVCVVVLADLHYYLPQPIFYYLKTVFSDQFEIMTEERRSCTLKMTATSTQLEVVFIFLLLFCFPPP